MTRKAEFNAEEWSTIADGPLYAGMRVIGADRGGTIRESLAMSRVYQEARVQHGAPVTCSTSSSSRHRPSEERLGAAGQNLPTVTTQELGKAIEILTAKASPSEVDDYKRFVMTVAQAVAVAHKEGGFLGIGGQTVSDAENRALDEISAALGSPPAG